MYKVSFHLLSQSQQLYKVNFAHYIIEKNRGPERLNDSSNATLLVSGRVGTQTQVFWLQVQCSFLSKAAAIKDMIQIDFSGKISLSVSYSVQRVCWHCKKNSLYFGLEPKGKKICPVNLLLFKLYPKARILFKRNWEQNKTFLFLAAVSQAGYHECQLLSVCQFFGCHLKNSCESVLWYKFPNINLANRDVTGFHLFIHKSVRNY